MAIEFKDIFLRIRATYEESGAFRGAERDLEALAERTSNAALEFDSLLKSTKRLSRDEIAFRFDSSSLSGALDDLKGISAELDKISKRRASVDPGVREQAKAMRESIEDQIAVLDELASTTEKVVKREKAAEADLMRYREKLRDLDEKAEKSRLTKREKDLKKSLTAEYNELKKAADARRKVDTGLFRGELSGALRRTVTDVGKVGRTLVDAAAQAENWGARLDGAAGVLTRLGPLMRGLGIVIMVSMVGAFVALIGAIGAATAALIAFAAALGAAVIPLIAMTMGFFSRLAAVMQAYKAHQDAVTEKAQLAKTAHQRQAAAAEQVRNAYNSLRDANENLATANQELADASDAMGQAQVDAMREIEDAAERASDAVRDLQDAQLGVVDAGLRLEEAKLRLKELGQQAGLTDDQLGDMFTKFEDVDLKDTEKLKKLLAESTAGMDEGAAIDFQQGMLDVAQAKLGIEEANDRVSDSERDLKRAQEDNLEVQKKGIEGTDAYKSAVSRLESATRGQRDATQRADEAQKDYNRSLVDQKKAIKGSREAWQRYKQQRDQLDDAEKGFLDTILGVGTALKTIVQKGTDPLFKAMSDLVPKFGLFVPFLTALSGQIGTDAADNMRKLADHLATFANIKRGLRLGDLASDIGRAFGGSILRNFVQTFLNLADAGAPLLRDVVSRIAVFMENIAQTTDNWANSKGFQLARKAFNDILDLVGAVVGGIVGLVEASAPMGTEFLDAIVGAAQGFSDWLNSEDGRKRIETFLETVVPFAEQLGIFIWKFGQLALEAFEMVAPAITDILKPINLVLELLNDVIDFINRHVPRAVRSFVFGMLIPIGWVGKIGSVTFKLLGWALRLLAKRGGIAGKVFGFLARVFGKIKLGFLIAALNGIGAVLDDVKDKFLDFVQWFSGLDIWGSIADGFNDAMEFLKGIPEQIISFFEDLWSDITGWWRSGSPSQRMFDLGVDIIQGLIDGIRSLAGRVAGALVNGIKGSARAAFNAGSWLVRRVLSGARNIATAVYNVGSWVVNHFLSGVRSLATTVFDAGKNVAQTVVNGVTNLATSAWDAGITLAKNILQGIWDGLDRGKDKVWNKAKEVGQGIWDWVAKPFDAHSPSRTMMTLGEQITQGLAIGLERGVGDVHRVIADNLGPGRLAGMMGDLPPVTMDVTRAVKDGLITGLASGGLVGRATIAALGEGKSKEAVLPLTRRIFDRLGAGITNSMAMRGPAALGVGSVGAAGMHGGGAYVIEKMDVILPPAPGYGTMGDPRHQAAQFAAELRRRGGSTVGGGGVT